MLSNIINRFATCAFALTVIACGGNEPATPEQQKELTTVVQTAAGHLKESKRFRELPGPTIADTTGTKGDFYSTSEKELRFLGEGVVATITNDSAEALFTLSVKKDSASSENRDALVQLVREGGKWRGIEAVIIGK